MLELGIVVVTWNTLDFLKPMLETVRTKHPHRIVVVDNNSSDGIDDWIKPKTEAQPDKWHFVKMNSCGSMGRNRNAGMKLAYELGCSHIVISQEDVLLHKDFIDNAVRLLNEKADFAMVAGWAILHYDLPEYWNKVFSPLRGVVPEQALKTHLVPEGSNDFRYMDEKIMETMLAKSPEIVRELDSIVPQEIYGSHFPLVCAVRKDFVEKVGYYDDGYTEAIYEDADLIHRMDLAVGRWGNCWATQLCLFIHWGGASHFNNNIDWWRTKDPKVMPASEQRYIRKWGGPILDEKFMKPVPQPSLWGTEHSYLWGKPF